MFDFLIDAVRDRNSEANVSKSLAVFHATKPRLYTPQAYHAKRRLIGGLIPVTEIITPARSWLAAWEECTPELVKIWRKKGRASYLERAAAAFVASYDPRLDEPVCNRQQQQEQQESAQNGSGLLRATLEVNGRMISLPMRPYPNR